ncbi:unnamed protein product [Angiostrongylus costaricensis]|uniref:Uncharacterized protein n=1 Tax=Angiostrongylus costaricensis TaxID=334426 RepID=A0A0R3PVZ1_ANGCS|nr:unnamed protein product [Angiostrongylus costaricensis]
MIRFQMNMSPGQVERLKTKRTNTSRYRPSMVTTRTHHSNEGWPQDDDTGDEDEDITVNERRRKGGNGCFRFPLNSQKDEVW